MKRTWMSLAMAVWLAAAAGIAFAQKAQPSEDRRPQLTAEEQAAVDQAKELWKQIEISRLELRLAELKEAPQSEIADKATRMYRLQGELHALRVKHPVVAQYQWRERGRRGWGRGRGRGGGPAWGGGDGLGRHGRHGMGRGRGHGRGAWCPGPGLGGGGRRGGGWGAGPGMGPGRGRGMGLGRGRGMAEPAWEWLPPARNVDAPTAGFSAEQELVD